MPLSTASAAPPAPTITTRERLALALLLTANFTLAVDFSILSVALPRIGRELGFATAQLQWIVTAFALCAAGFTLLFGRVADLVGRKRMFIAGIVLLGVASIAGGLAQSPAVLLAARVGQGLATAMVIPAALALLTTMFAEGPARSRALGLNGALMAAGFTTGAVLGGVLTETVSWRWAFFINVAVAAVVLLAAPGLLRDQPASRRPRLDLAGAFSITLALSLLVFALSEAGEAGWGDPLTVGAFVAAAVLLLVFWVVEHRVAEPLISPAILRRGNVAWGNVAGLLAFATETSLVFVLTLYLQDILGFSAAAAGLSLAVLGVGTVLGGLLAPRVIGRVTSKGAIVAGLAVQAAATAPLAFAGPGDAWIWPLLVLTFIGGIANLVAIVGYTVTATAGVPADSQGLATGLVTLSQQIGITVGTPVMSAVIAGQLGAGLLDGVRLAIAVNAAVALVAAVVIAVKLRVPAEAA